nr:N-acetylmuramoyl-L-alanine amidase [Blautia sp. MSJ-19]
MKKYRIEMIMACLLLVCFYLLSRQAAVVSVQMTTDQEKGKNSEGQVQENAGRKLILVDPGHGESDPGMIGVGGLEEKGINLSISLLLKENLERRGYSVVMTRDTDKGLYDASSNNKKAQDMQRRVALISEKSPLLSVSIHQNSYQDPAVHGPQVFYYESSSEGKKLAEAIQGSLNEKLEVDRQREIKGNTSYYLLKRSQGTLVIVECGFLTNPDEAAKLQTESYQKKVADAIADGVDHYLEIQ